MPSNSKQELAEYYNQNAEEYHTTIYRKARTYSPLQYRQRYIEMMIDRLGLTPGSRILDAGCGPGELVLSLAKRGYAMWGMDISSAMIARAQSLASCCVLPIAVQLTVGDIESLEFESSFFDVVVAAGVIEYQKEDIRSLTEIGRVLKPGGFLILNVTNRYAYIYVFRGISDWLKRDRTARIAFDFVRERVARTNPSSPSPHTRTHSPFQFDRLLQRQGFTKVAHNYFHFSPLPRPLDIKIGRICRPIGKWMECLTVSPIAVFLGGGYLVTARRAVK